MSCTKCFHIETSLPPLHIKNRNCLVNCSSSHAATRGFPPKAPRISQAQRGSGWQHVLFRQHTHTQQTARLRLCSLPSPLSTEPFYEGGLGCWLIANHQQPRPNWRQLPHQHLLLHRIYSSFQFNSGYFVKPNITNYKVSLKGLYNLYTYDIPVPGPHIGSVKTPKK